MSTTLTAHLATIFEAVEEGILVFGPDKTLLAFNGPAKRLLGPLTSGQPVTDFEPQPDAQAWTRENRQAAPPTRHCFRRQGALVFVRDDSAALIAEIEHSRVLNMAAHELRNPLATILGFSEVLTDPHLERDKADTYLGFIHQKASRMNDLVDTLLDLSRSELGKSIPLTLKKHPLATLAAEAIKALADDYETTAVQTELPELSLTTDKKKFRKVLIALLENSLKFGADQIKLSARAEADQLTLTVSDNGPGIPAEHLDAVWQKFVGFDAPNGRAHGPGLGLTMVKSVVAALKGSVGLATSPAGTTVTLTLPLGEA